MTNPSEVSAGRVEALHKGQKLVRFFEELLHEAGYFGPVAIAGGYLRDVALCRHPKDLDLFLDGGLVGGMDGADNLAGFIANRLIGATMGRSVPCYGRWAEDISCLTTVNLSASEQKRERMMLDNWPSGCVVPEETVDLVVLLRPRLVEVGFQPRLVNDAYNQELFLKAVLARVDLRLNALGATPAITLASPKWDMDAYNSRLVIQKARISEDQSRLVRRLQRLTEEKFLGWKTFCEQEDGTLAPLPLGDGPAGSAAA